MVKLLIMLFGIYSIKYYYFIINENNFMNEPAPATPTTYSVTGVGNQIIWLKIVEVQIQCLQMAIKIRVTTNQNLIMISIKVIILALLD